MQIFLNPIELPFKVGDIVFVNHEHGERLPEKKGPRFPYFQAEIARIFFDGRLEELTVISEPVDSFQMEIKTVVYELKPIGQYSDLVRMPLRLSLPIKEPKLFPSEADLLAYVRTLSQLETEDKAKPPLGV